MSLNFNYILDTDGRTPILAKDELEWAKWFEENFYNRQVASTEIGNVHVSTVFLGIDHSFGGPHPILFETMIFDGDEDGYCDRYTTWELAEEGHQRAVNLVRAALEVGKLVNPQEIRNQIRRIRI